MFSELIKNQVKPFESSLKSNYMVFAFDRNDCDQEQIGRNLSDISTLCQMVAGAAQDNQIELDGSDYQVTISSPKTAEVEYFALDSHISIGYSPFMFHKREGKVVGIYTKIKHFRSTYCKKTIRRLAQELYESNVRQDGSITLKQANAVIIDSLAANKQEYDVPLLDSASYIFSYIDLEHGRLLTKSGRRDQDSINVFAELLRRSAILMNDQGLIKASPLIETAFKERIQISPFVNWALNRDLAYGSYSISDMIEFYAAHEGTENPDEKCDVEPTMTAGFFSKENPDEAMRFKNSIYVMMSPETQEFTPSFNMLQKFSIEKNLSVNDFNVIGTTPKSELITQYCEEFPEQVLDAEKGDYLQNSYTTRSKNGNIMFKIIEGFKPHFNAANKLLKNHIEDRHLPIKDIEPVFLDYISGTLAILHDSTELFVTMYLNANRYSKETESENALMDAMNKRDVSGEDISDDENSIDDSTAPDKELSAA